MFPHREHGIKAMFTHRQHSILAMFTHREHGVNSVDELYLVGVWRDVRVEAAQPAVEGYAAHGWGAATWGQVW